MPLSPRDRMTEVTPSGSLGDTARPLTREAMRDSRICTWAVTSEAWAGPTISHLYAQFLTGCFMPSST
jgi:hypothetical protein